MLELLNVHLDDESLTKKQESDLEKILDLIHRGKYDGTKYEEFKTEVFDIVAEEISSSDEMEEESEAPRSRSRSPDFEGLSFFIPGLKLWVRKMLLTPPLDNMVRELQAHEMRGGMSQTFSQDVSIFCFFSTG